MDTADSQNPPTPLIPTAMEIQPLPLPPEFRAALDANGGLPIHFEDPETHERYVLQETPVEITLDEDFINEELAKGLADFEAGRFGPWDIEATLAEAHRRHAAQKRMQ